MYSLKKRKTQHSFRSTRFVTLEEIFLDLPGNSNDLEEERLLANTHEKKSCEKARFPSSITQRMMLSTQKKGGRCTADIISKWMYIYLARATTCRVGRTFVFLFHEKNPSYFGGSAGLFVSPAGPSSSCKYYQGSTTLLLS